MTHLPFTHQVDVYHLVLSGDKESYEVTPSYTSLKVGIIPAGSDILAVYPGESAYSLYQMFVYDDVTIKNGDKVVGGGETFYVRGVPQVFNVLGHYHQEVVLEKVVGT